MHTYNILFICMYLVGWLVEKKKTSGELVSVKTLCLSKILASSSPLCPLFMAHTPLIGLTSFLCSNIIHPFYLYVALVGGG
jgi:hypothetical protein